MLRGELVDSEGKKALGKLIIILTPLAIYGAFTLYLFRQEKRRAELIYHVEDFQADIGLD